MKNINLSMVFLLALFSSMGWAAELNSENLVGKWEFVNWAEAASPKETHAVNVVMDFRPDGQVHTEMPKGTVIESYKIDGDTIVYQGKRGEQKWALVSFTPAESMVVDNSGTIMTFVRK